MGWNQFFQIIKCMVESGGGCNPDHIRHGQHPGRLFGRQVPGCWVQLQHPKLVCAPAYFFGELEMTYQCYILPGLVSISKSRAFQFY